jgi:hypothetical protein
MYASTFVAMHPPRLYSAFRCAFVTGFPNVPGRMQQPRAKLRVNFGEEWLLVAPERIEVSVPIRFSNLQNNVQVIFWYNPRRGRASHLSAEVEPTTV